MFSYWAIFPVVLVLLLESPYNHGHSTGAPPFSCTTMTPGHGRGPQTTPPPYNITVSPINDGVYRIKLTATKDYFVGYLLRPKVSPKLPGATDDFSGTFIDVPAESSILNCGTEKASAVTHSSNSKKRSVEIDWQPPANYQGTVYFVATFVFEFSTFWVGVQSLPIQISKSAASSRSPFSNSNDEQLNAALLSVYEGCGSNKNCVAFPEDCLRSKSCDGVASVQFDSGVYQIEMFAKGAKFVAIGFSEDAAMGGDNVAECTDENGRVQLHRSWNEPNRKKNQRLDDSRGVSLVNGLVAEGAIYCKIHIEPVTLVHDEKFDLNNQRFFLLLAAGRKLSERQAGIGYHDLFKVSSKTSYLLSEVSAESSIDSFYKDCSITKTCFGVPEGCVEKQNCLAVTAITVQGNRFIFSMQAKSAKYIATGLSDDLHMGDDLVFECVEDAQSNQVRSYMSWNIGGTSKYNERLRDNYGKLINGSLVDGKLQCVIVVDTPTFNVRGRTFNLVRDKYVLMVAAGSNVTPPGSDSPGNVRYHDIGRAVGAQPRALADVSAVKAASKLLIVLHGSFMVAAWVGLASLGIVMARYYKQTWITGSCFGKDIWFFWHRLFMFTAVILTIAGSTMIYIHSGGFIFGSPGETHMWFGFATFLLAVLQPIGAFFRPHPGTSRRPIFNWLHWLMGNSAHILSIVTIFLAVDLTKAELPHWTDYILAAFVAYYVIDHLLLTFIGWKSESSGRGSINEIQLKNINPPRNMPPAYEREKDAPYSGARKFLFTLHFLIIVGFCVSLIWIIAKSPIG